MNAMVVLDPTGSATVASAELAARPASFAGLVVGYLDNGKPNSDRLLAHLAERLQAAGARESVHVRKGSIGRLAEPAIVAELVRRCDVVVSGVGDCAGCCSCTVQDGIALERQGVASYVVCTTELVTIARIAARTAGIPDYPLTVIDHPLGALTDGQLAERAADAATQILAAGPGR